LAPASALDVDSAAQRKRLREAALRARQAMPEAQRACLTLRLAAHLDGLMALLQPRRLGFCWPYRAEPDLRQWVCGWRVAAPGRVAALPVVLERDAAMVFRAWEPDQPMVLDRHGIPHPAAGDSLIPDVVLVPLNAFDACGYRLGYGGGYFDRTLAGMDTVAVGVGFELGRVPSTLPQPHDKPMEWIVTEAGAARALP